MSLVKPLQYCTMWFAVFWWLYFLLAEIKIIPAEARTLCALLTLTDESGSGGGLQPQRSLYTTRYTDHTVFCPLAGGFRHSFWNSCWKFLAVCLYMYHPTSMWSTLSCKHGGIWRTIHCRLHINCYGTGLWVGDGIATPPPPPSTQTKSQADSVTINAKTTVHCSPVSSMSVSIVTQTARNTELVINKSTILICCDIPWRNVLFKGRQKKKNINCLLSEEWLRPRFEPMTHHSAGRHAKSLDTLS